MHERIEIETSIKEKIYMILKKDLDKNIRFFKKNQKIKAITAYRDKYFPNGDLDYAFHIYANKFTK